MDGSPATGTVLIESGRVIDPSQGIDTVASVLVSGGRVVEVGSLAGMERPGADHLVDATGLIVSPGFVDIHAHLRYPGLPDKETIASGTSAAIRGGFTTVCAMANSKPPVDSGSRVDIVQARIQAEARCHVRVIGAVSRGLEGHEIADSRELAGHGVVALSDDGNPVADSHIMRSVLAQSEKLGIPVSAHEETRPHKDRRDGGCWTCSGEVDMVRRDLDLLRATGGKLHIAHVSCAESVALISDAQSAGLEVSAEATPHHFWLSDDGNVDRTQLPPRHGYRNVNPPLRGAGDVRAIQDAIAAGVITAIATDHAPHTAAEKSGGMESAAYGFTAFELALPLLLRLVESGVLTLFHAVERLTIGPARAFGLRAGTLAIGQPADICLFDPEASWQVSRDTIVSKGKNTPLIGERLTGRVRAILVGGAFYEFGEDHGLRTLRAS